MGVLYGPVPSWRLGRSLGIDLLPGRGKICSFDCVYCQLGRTSRFTVERQVYVEMEKLKRDLDALPLTAADVDYLTFSGTGEPTLAANLGEAIDLVRSRPALQGVPVAVLTNATLLSRSDVCRDLAHADLVVAKLDVPDEALFRTVNRPFAGVSWVQVVKGIQEFRQQFGGRLALQMMFIGANRRRADEMATLARSLNPDEVQLNTPLRASPAPPLERAAMAKIELVFSGLPVVNVYEAQPPTVRALDMAEMRRRRPVEGHPQAAEMEVS
ncbi:MAG: radical SAM protein, partial [Anaerolineae bacterium]|nr:radical SAM protein [Anaerolineae bacterium]